MAIIMLTFDKMRELERAERESRKLQKLPDGLADQLREYLRKKEAMKTSSAEIMELENVRATVKRFFELREKKITEAALYTARTGLPAENLTKEEEKLYYSIITLLKSAREAFFTGLQKPPQPDIELVEEVREAAAAGAPASRQAAYKVLQTMPEFVGPDLQTYRLDENQILALDALPKPLNEFLLKKGIIEKVEN